MKECKICKRLVDEKDFPLRSRHSHASRTSCRNCETASRKARGYRALTVEQKKKKSLRTAATHKRFRSNPANAAKIIVKDAKNTDNRKGFINDLTNDFVATLISDGCAYCGETSIKMTMDRIDNSRGHTQDNVVPACYRCNMIRRSMPYGAWLNIVPAIRDTLEKGLFTGWGRFGPWPGIAGEK